MRIFLQAQDFDILNIIESKYIEPTVIVEGEEKPKPKDTWTAQERAKFILNAKVMNLFFCALDRNEFNRVSTYKTTYDIWHTLEVTYRGTS